MLKEIVDAVRRSLMMLSKQAAGLNEEDPVPILIYIREELVSSLDVVDAALQEARDDNNES